MTSRKRNLFYALIALLFLILLAVISWLLYMILNFRIEPPPDVEQQAPAVRLRTASPGPFSEMLIRVKDEPIESMETEEEKVTGRGVAASASGQIPSICESYGPQIHSREAFPNPLTHQSIAAPTRTTVILNINPESP